MYSWCSNKYRPRTKYFEEVWQGSLAKKSYLSSIRLSKQLWNWLHLMEIHSLKVWFEIFVSFSLKLWKKCCILLSLQIKTVNLYNFIRFDQSFKVIKNFSRFMENTLDYQRNIAKSMRFFTFLSWDELNKILLNQKNEVPTTKPENENKLPLETGIKVKVS